MSAFHKIRLLLADDHFVVRMGLAASLRLEPDFEVVAEAATAEEAIAFYKQHRPDVAVLDWRLPDLTGVEVTATIRQFDPKARILILSAFSGEEDVFRVVQAGAESYLLKNARRAEIVQAIRTLHAGGQYFPPEISAIFAARLRREELTAREKSVLVEIVKGSSNKEIGSLLEITESAVKLHVTHLLQKLQAKDRTHAATIAIQRGIVHLE
ncbi:MAG TPA: response regulator transcription factor [Chthoniobacteraceae bacterium]|jgi:two-component system NarL family response regulator